MARVVRFTKYLSGHPKGRVLFSHLKDLVWEEKRGIGTNRFSQNGEARAWAKVLNQMGYIVDAINWDDTGLDLNRQYDIVVLHGGKNYKELIPLVKPGGKIVYYSTGSYWRYHNDQEAKRFEAFTKRNNVTLTHDRHIDDDEEAANRAADAIISLGNSDTAATYKDFPSVYSIQAAVYPGTPEIIRDFSVARKHFIFLSGPGSVHKGLDLALEAFRELPDLHLHVMGTFLNKDFEDFYHKDLYESPNIHTYGFVHQRTPLFYAAVRQCAYSLLLSCSEGSPGSVIESMQHGMVPVVTKTSHIDLPPVGILVKDIHIEAIRKTVLRASQAAPAKLAADSKQVRKYVAGSFSLSRFERDLKKILIDIINKS